MTQSASSECVPGNLATTLTFISERIDGMERKLDALQVQTRPNFGAILGASALAVTILGSLGSLVSVFTFRAQDEMKSEYRRQIGSTQAIADENRDRIAKHSEELSSIARLADLGEKFSEYTVRRLEATDTKITDVSSKLDDKVQKEMRELISNSTALVRQQEEALEKYSDRNALMMQRAVDAIEKRLSRMEGIGDNHNGKAANGAGP